MTYHTDNIAVAAALKINGYSIESVQVDFKKATFHFSPEAEAAAIEIQLGKKLVDAIQFHQEIRRLSGLARSMVKDK